jgi:hypothetical protein
MNDGDGLGLCIDRIFQDEHVEKARAIAKGENPKNDPSALPAEKLAVAVLKQWKPWKPGRTLRIRFLDGSEKLQERVIAAALLWTEHANIRFGFGVAKDAEIRISFQADARSWSALGTDALVEEWYPKYQPTMSFGWLRDGTKDEEVSRVVLHEFGHALGCIHEHSSPGSTLKWKEEAVYAYFSGPPAYWSKEAIQRNVLQRYDKAVTQFSAFDPSSIMLYRFPAALFEDGAGTRLNTTLSAADVAFIREQYPR